MMDMTHEPCHACHTRHDLPRVPAVVLSFAGLVKDIERSGTLAPHIFQESLQDGSQ